MPKEFSPFLEPTLLTEINHTRHATIELGLFDQSLPGFGITLYRIAFLVYLMQFFSFSLDTSTKSMQALYMFIKIDTLVKATFALAEKDGFEDVQKESVLRVENGLDQLEKWEYRTISDPVTLPYLDSEQKWKGIVRSTAPS